MTQTIYIDVLLAVNLFVNYLLLLSVRRYLRLQSSLLRLLLGAAIGALGSLIIFLPELCASLSLLFKLFLSAAIVFAAFGGMRIPMLIKAGLSFYFISFAYAGFMLAIWYFISPQNITVRNTVVYLNISPVLLALLTAAAYGGLGLFVRLRREKHALYCTLKIENDGATASCVGKIDTGNSLVEPFSGAPVMVAQYSAVRPVLPVEMSDDISNSLSGIRLIPFADISGDGVLPAFKPEKVTVVFGKKAFNATGCFIAVTKKNFPSGSFGAILNPDILNLDNSKDEKS